MKEVLSDIIPIVYPMDFGLFGGLNITQAFNEKVKKWIHQLHENLNADNKELLQTLKEELQIKNKHIEELL